MNIGDNNCRISAYFHMSEPELVEKTGDFLEELNKLVDAIDQGKALEHTLDGRLIILDPHLSPWTDAIAVKPGVMPVPQTLNLLEDLLIVRLKIQQLDLATSRQKQLSSIQNLCKTIILGQAIKPSLTQANLLKALEFADRGHEEYWNVLKRDFGNEAPHFAKLRQLFEAMRADPLMLNRALLDAAQKGQFEVVKLLSQDERIEDEFLIIAMELAAQHGHKEVLLLLITKYDSSYAVERAICGAAKYGHLNIVKLLLPTIVRETVKDFCRTNITELLGILIDGDQSIEFIKSLIQDERFHFSARVLITKAAEKGLAEVVAILLSKKDLSTGYVGDVLENALFEATLNGHKEVVRVLLDDERVDPDHLHLRNRSIFCAAKKGDVEMLGIFLENPRVLKPMLDRDIIDTPENKDSPAVRRLRRADKDFHTAIQLAAAHGHAAAVVLLLEDERSTHEELFHLTALITAIEKGHLHVLEAVVPLAGPGEIGEALHVAVEQGPADAVTCLLTSEELDHVDLDDVANIGKENSFKVALEKGHIEVIKILSNNNRFDPHGALKNALVDGVKLSHAHHEILEVLAQNPRTKILKILLESLLHSQDPAYRNFIEIMCATHIKLFGLPLSMAIPLDADKVESLQRYLINPVTYLESVESKFRQPPKIIAAVKIIFTAEQVKVHKRRLALAERNRNRFNNVDSETRIGAVRKHYKTVIQPHFSSVFASYGTTQAEQIVAIEYRMREMFLAAIKQEAEENKDGAQVVAFINSLTDEEKSRLLKGNDAALMKKARALFSSGASAAQTAWRAYDRWAPVRGEWPNLLAEPLANANQAAYTVAAVGLQNPTTKMASDLSREMVAYSFLLAIDKNDGDEDIRATRKTAFIAKVAEIQRAHNSQERQKDDPSCLPGTISRVGDMWIAHAKNITPDVPKLLEEELRSMVIAQFQKTPKAEQSDLHRALLQKCTYNEGLKGFIEYLVQETPSEQTNLYNALVMLSSYNAEAIIQNRAPFSADQIALRHAFIDSLGTQQELREALNARFTARGSRVLSDAEFNTLVPALLADIGGPWIAPQLTAIYRDGATLENPYTYIATQKGISQQAAIAMLIKVLAAVEMENKMKFIMATAQHIASGSINVAQDELIKLGISASAITDAIAEVEKENALFAEKRQKKAAVWEKLYHDYDVKNMAIPDKAEVLTEIVDQVVDHNRDIETALGERI